MIQTTEQSSIIAGLLVNLQEFSDENEKGPKIAKLVRFQFLA